jgi:hypothetical protein
MKIESKEHQESTNPPLLIASVGGSVYSMDLLLKEIEDKLQGYRKGNEHLEDYEIGQTLTDFQKGYRYCLKNVNKYIEEKGMWQERMLRA